MTRSRKTPDNSTAPRAALAVAVGSAPWAWTATRDDEYWQPAGNSRDMALAIARPKAGRRKFWIARCRRMDASEREQFEGSWIVDTHTEELITPNK